MNLNSKHIYDYYGYRVGDTRCRNGKCCNLISVGCVQWDFPSTELYNKKETLEEILRKIEELLLSSFPISNIGGGYELYAGVHNGENTFRTLTAADGIIITQNSETIQIGFDTSSIPPQGVTSVAMTVPTGFTVGGSPITSTGTFALNYAAGYTGYTTAEQSKLSGIEAGAQVNVPETDPTVPAHVKSILTGDISNWNTAFGWGDHSSMGYATQTWVQSQGYLTSLPDLSIYALKTTTVTGVGYLTGGGSLEQNRVIDMSTTSKTKLDNGQEAYSWGNHATVGYLTTETDPTVPNHVKAITSTQVSNWDTAYSQRIQNLTTTGSSGVATLNSNTLNIPSYTLAGLGGVPTSRTITINGTTQNLSANRTWTIAPDYSSLTNERHIKKTAGGLADSNIQDTPNGVEVTGLATITGTVSELDSSDEKTLVSKEWVNTKKLDKPLADGTFLVNKSGAVVSYVSADDFGQNIGNSDLTISEPRVLDTDGKPFSIANLPDKSDDATFIDFLGKSRSGQMAKVGFEAFKQQVSDWTDPQKTQFATILNGGFSTGTMSVFSIMPQVFELEDNNLYITLNGANLSLNPSLRKIEILRDSDGVKVGEVPSNQISESIANRLTFYYNFNSLGAGEYKFRLTNGAIVYTTNLSATILSSITNIDLSSVTWDIQTDYANTQSYGNGDTLFYKAERHAVHGTLPIFSGKSSELFAVGEDFYLELNLERSLTSGASSSSGTRLGVGYSNQINELLFKNLNYGILASRYTGSAYRITYGVKGAGVSDSLGNADSNTLIIVKQGNMLRVSINERTNVETISNNSGYSLFIQAPEKISSNESNAEQITIQITKAYKF